MRALLLPVKDLRNAKKRLAEVLSLEERFAIASAMLADTIRAVQGVRRADKIFVVTNYEPVMQVAAQNHWEILREDQQISESHSVDAASKICEQRGVTGLLRLPLDLPLIQSSDIDELLSISSQAPALVIVPSRDGTGTNALLRRPPTLFPSHFGHNSFPKHLSEAENAHAQILILRNPHLEMDIDDESDLRELLRRDLGRTETGRWLRSSGVHARLAADLSAEAMTAP